MATKELKSKKAVASNAKKSSPSHPAYLEMIGEAIGSLKERTGSSQIAISKFIEDKHKEYQLPSNFKKLLLVKLKKLTASGKLTKIKNSYKLTAPTKNLKSAVSAAKPKAKVAIKPKVKSPAKKKVKVLPAKKVAPVAKKAVIVTKPKVKSSKMVVTPAKKAGTVAKFKVKSAKKVVKSPAKNAVALAVKKSKK